MLLSGVRSGGDSYTWLPGTIISFPDDTEVQIGSRAEDRPSGQTGPGGVIMEA